MVFSPWLEANVSRRSVLAAAGASGLFLTLAGCTRPVTEEATGLINIPDPASALPTGDVTFRVVDSGDTKAAYWKELLGAYHDKHENITTKYDGLPWTQINELVPLSVRNGTLHDLVQMAPGALYEQAIVEGWIRPLDDVMPNFEEWKAQYPKNVLFEGIHMFGGKTYAVPSTADNRDFLCLLYGEKMMDEAGYNPQETPLTWDDYRDAAAKITKKGAGKAYGIVLEGKRADRLDIWLGGFAAQAGGYGSDPLTGEFDYTNDAWASAFDLMMALMADGSIFPGSVSLDAAQAWARVASEDAGMVTGGGWVGTAWENDNPDFKFGVGSHPNPGPGALPRLYAPGGMSDAMCVYANSENPEIAGDIMAYHLSFEGQKAWGEIVGPASPPVYPEAVEFAKGKYTNAGRRMVELAEQLVLGPSSLVRNPDVAKAYQAMPPLTPSLGEIVAGVLAGSITDVKPVLQDLSDRAYKSRDEGIAAAVAAGATVSREDWVFPNFVPGEPYTQESYAAL